MGVPALLETVDAAQFLDEDPPRERLAFLTRRPRREQPHLETAEAGAGLGVRGEVVHEAPA